MSTPAITASSPSFWEGVQEKVYVVQDKLLGSTTEDKVNSLMIVGGVLIFAALAGTVAACAVAGTLLNPVVMVAAAGMLPIFLFGIYTSFNAEGMSDFLQNFRPFVPGQPIGLYNQKNNCWMNASLQVLLRSPTFQARMRQIPEFARLVDASLAANAGRHKVSNFDSQALRQFLNRDTAGLIHSGDVQEDATQIFEYLFQGPNALYRFEQLLNGAPAAVRPEPMIQLDMSMNQTLPSFQQLFNSFFDHRTDTGARQQFFFPRSPNELLIQMKRFTQFRDPINGNYREGKINDPIDIPERIAVPPQFVRTGENVQYDCDAFLIHNGTSLHGGHYTSYVKSGGTWWYCSDTIVYEVSLSDVAKARSNAFICHYIKA